MLTASCLSSLVQCDCAGAQRLQHGSLLPLLDHSDGAGGAEVSYCPLGCLFFPCSPSAISPSSTVTLTHTTSSDNILQLSSPYTHTPLCAHQGHQYTFHPSHPVSLPPTHTHTHTYRSGILMVLLPTAASINNHTCTSTAGTLTPTPSNLTCASSDIIMAGFISITVVQSAVVSLSVSAAVVVLV